MLALLRIYIICLVSPSVSYLAIYLSIYLAIYLSIHLYLSVYTLLLQAAVLALARGCRLRALVHDT